MFCTINFCSFLHEIFLFVRDLSCYSLTSFLRWILSSLILSLYSFLAYVFKATYFSLKHDLSWIPHIFSLSSKYCLIFIVVSSLTQRLFRIIFCIFQTYGNFLAILSLYIDMWSSNKFYLMSFLWNLLHCIMVQQFWKISTCIWKECVVCGCWVFNHIQFNWVVQIFCIISCLWSSCSTSYTEVFLKSSSMNMLLWTYCCCEFAYYFLLFHQFLL